MAIEAVFVQGDTAPPIRAQLVDEEDGVTPIDLTGATVKFQMRRLDDQILTVDAAATVVGSATQGNVSYLWAANDLSVPGEYDAQWRVTFIDGRIQTQAVASRILVRRR